MANKYIPLPRAILPMNDNTSGYTSAKKSAKDIEIRWNPGWTAIAVTRGARGRGAPQAPSSQQILGKSSGTKAKYITRNPGWTAVAATRGARGQDAPQAPSSQHILGKSSGTKAKYIFSPAFQQNLSLTVHFLL